MLMSSGGVELMGMVWEVVGCDWLDSEPSKLPEPEACSRLLVGVKLAELSLHDPLPELLGTEEAVVMDG